MDLRRGSLRDMKRLLLIGATGAVGQELAPLLRRDYEVIAVGSEQFSLPEAKGLYRADIVVNLAALSLLNDLSEFHILNRKLIEVNCLGAVNILATFIPDMRIRKYGRIIMMSSVCSEVNLPLHGVYSASKSFVDKLVKIAAIENAQYGITVNSIQLGYTGIGMGDNTPAELLKMKNKPAMKRFCSIFETYKAIKFIIETEYYTGQNLRLDGGIK